MDRALTEGIDPGRGGRKMIRIRQARPDESALISSILREVAQWLIDIGQPLWKLDELAPDAIALQVRQGMFHIADVGGQPAGCIRFQLDDPLFWPDVPADESAFVHRVAVRRQFAGGEVSAAMLQWAKDHARSLGRQFLRLDTDATRPKLGAIYERNGFVRHSQRKVGPYLVTRYECRL